jgi:hypothetical protein
MQSYWFSLLSYALPELFALGVALTLLLTNARPGPGRQLGLIGIGVMLIASCAGLAVSVVQGLSLSGGGGMSMSSVMTVLRTLINIASLGGLLCVVWGLCRATQAGAPPSR